MRPARAPAIVLAALLLPTTALTAQEGREPPRREPIVGLPCEGCEGVFDRLPDSLDPVARIAPRDEPGEPMRIDGTVYDPEGRPVPGVIVYAYHTNAHGIYPEDDLAAGTAGRRHGRLRGWARTDARGHYRFDTIRPAPYPGRDNPAHVHMHVIEIGRCTYYLDSIHFTDDPLLGAEERAASEEGRGGSGLVRPSKGAGGVWIARRDIVLGLNVPGYERCGG